jgi:hypothetical protein
MTNRLYLDAIIFIIAAISTLLFGIAIFLSEGFTLSVILCSFAASGFLIVGYRVYRFNKDVEKYNEMVENTRLTESETKELEEFKEQLLRLKQLAIAIANDAKNNDTKPPNTY